MDAMKRLSAHLKTRISELWKMKNNGTRIVGYPPGGYMPEELIYASGAIPVGLIRGGDPEPIAESLAYIPRFIDTFCRSQIGYRMMGEEPLYQLPDILVDAVTDNNNKAIADCWQYYTDVDVFRFGVPNIRDDMGLKYYTIGLNRLKDELESFTGNKISDEKLKEEIASMNRMRHLFQEISNLRRDGHPVISSRDYVRLHHASYYAEKTEMINILEDLYSELKDMESQPVKGPRFLLAGSTLAMGDQKIFELLEGNAANASIVREEFAECIRPYTYTVGLDGDPIAALADAYFMKRIPPAWFVPSDDTMDYLIQLTKDFNVDGVIWYQMMYRESYDMQSKCFEEKMKKISTIPMLKLETDYDTSEKGPFKTRIETIIQIAQGG